MNKYRIKTKILPEQNQYIKVNIEQDFDVLDILTLSIYGTDAYPNPCGDWGVIIGRVVDNNSFPMENVKVGYITSLDEDDSNDITVSTIYNSIRNNPYPLLPNYRVNKNHYPVGGFPSEDEVMSNSVLEYVYKKYFKYVTSTNQNGDYAILGVPLGSGELLMNFDSTDAGSLSTTPIQQIATQQKNKGDFKIDRQNNNSPKGANGGVPITGKTEGQIISLGNISTGSGEGGGTVLLTGATASGFGANVGITNQNGDTVSVIQKLVPNIPASGSGTLISRGNKVYVKSFFGDTDQCDIGINRYDYKLDYSYQPCNYIIGSFFSDFNVFKTATPTYSLNNMALATSKQNMGGKVSFLLDGFDVNEPDISADVASDGSFYAAIPCKWDRYNIDEEGNWFKTNDDFTQNPTGIFTRTPYCLMVYINQNVNVNLNDGKTYSRASGIGFNLNNSANYVTQIGLDGSTGLTSVTRFGINYNAQYYLDSPFPNGYYYSIKPEYYPYPNDNAGTLYRNGAELNWDYINRRSNVYTLATQWTKYGYYSAINIENNGLGGLSYTDILSKGRFSPTPNLYSTKSLTGNTQLITTITTNGIKTINNVNKLPLDDDGPYGWNSSYQRQWNLDTGYYPDGNIGRTNAYNGGIDFEVNNITPDVGSWVFGDTTNSYFQVNSGNAGKFKIKGRLDLRGWYDAINDGGGPRYFLEIVLYRGDQNIKIYNKPSDFLPGGGKGKGWYDWGVTWMVDFEYYFQDGDKIYFNFHTDNLIDRMSFRLENCDVSFYKIPAGTIFPLIIGNMYLPTFEATKYDTAYYPVGDVRDILDVNNGGFNSVKLEEVDVMLYPITDELFDIVEHTQINNPYENGVINYYFFSNQYWKLRDFIYNELN
jgi:hypothetical protein